MTTYRFTATLAPLPMSFDEAAERLYEAGCDDGGFGESRGVAAVEFDRDAASLREAIESAIADIEKAGLQVVRIDTEETATINEINGRLVSA